MKLKHNGFVLVASWQVVPMATGPATAAVLSAPRTLAGFPRGLLEDLLLVEALLGLLLFVGAVEHRPAGQHKLL